MLSGFIDWRRSVEWRRQVSRVGKKERKAGNCQPAGDETSLLTESHGWIDGSAISHFLPFSCCNSIYVLHQFIRLLVCVHTSLNQTHRSIAAVWREKAERKSLCNIDRLPTLCVSLCERSWLTTEWSSASGGLLSSKPSSSHRRALCSIITSTQRARSLNLGPRW